MKPFAPLLLLLFSGLSLRGGSGEGMVRDRIDLKARRQTIASFGASDCWTIPVIGREWSEESKEVLARLLFSRTEGIGLSQWRVNLGAGPNPVSIADPWHVVESFESGPGEYDWRRAPGSRWFLRAAKRYGVEQLVAFVNSPLSRLTVNGLSNAHGLDPRTCNLAPGKEAEFAGYLGEVIDHFARNPDPAERVSFLALSPLNEPEWEWTGKQEGMPAANADLLRVARALERELERRSLSTFLLLPEAGHLGDMLEPNRASSRRLGSEAGNYIARLAIEKRLLRRSKRILAYHSYWSDGPELVPLRRVLRRNAQREDIDLWQSEYCIMERGRDLGMAAALRLARVIQADLTVAEVSSWCWWLALSGYDFKDGLIYTDWKRAGDPETIAASKLLWALGHWSRFVRPGMVRLAVNYDAPQNPEGLTRSAFADYRRVVAVYVNPGPAEVRIQPQLVNGHFPPRSPRLFLTGEAPGENLKEAAPVPADSLVLPPRSMATLVWER